VVSLPKLEALFDESQWRRNVTCGDLPAVSGRWYLLGVPAKSFLFDFWCIYNNKLSASASKLGSRPRKLPSISIWSG